MTQVAPTAWAPSVFVRTVGMVLPTPRDFEQLTALGVLAGQYAAYVAGVEEQRAEHRTCGMDSQLGVVRYQDYLSHCLMNGQDPSNPEVFDLYCHAHVEMYRWRGAVIEYLAMDAAVTIAIDLDRRQLLDVPAAATAELLDAVHAFVHAEDAQSWEISFEFRDAAGQEHRATVPMGSGCGDAEDEKIITTLALACITYSGLVSLRIFSGTPGRDQVAQSTVRVWETCDGSWNPLTAAGAFARACTTSDGDFIAPPPGVEHLSAEHPPVIADHEEV